MTEQRIRTLQKEVGKNLRRRKFPWRDPDVDGKLGPITFKAAGFALYQMGAPDKMVRQAHEGHIGRTAFDYLTHRKARPDSWLRRDKNRRPHCAKLRRLHREMVEEAKSLDGIVLSKYGSGVYVAKWIEAENDKIHAAGCSFVVVSGFRTQAYSESLCIAMCGATTCPGRCAGIYSNHACPPSGKCMGPPAREGAEDVTNYYEFKATAARIGSLLHNDLPADPVHFSASGH